MDLHKPALIVYVDSNELTQALVTTHTATLVI